MSLRSIFQKPNTEGRHGDADVRRLVTFVQLAEHRDPVTGDALPLIVRQGLLESDIREAMAVAARRLWQQAQTHHNAGFSESMEEVEYDITRLADDGNPKREFVPTVVASLVIRRKR